MTKILLLGHYPPNVLSHQKIDAANYRTRQFLEPLLDDGHTICFCVQKNDLDSKISIPAGWDGKVEIHPIAYHQAGWRKSLQQAHDDFNPDCIVAVNFDMCLNATGLKTEKPIWMDIYGDYLTIVQAACYRARSDRGVLTSIKFVREVLKKGDIFSVCGATQAHLMVGELALAERLNYRTFGYEFTKIIYPGAIRPEAVSPLSSPPPLHLDGSHGNDFTVIWCGGYNTWTDIETLFKGLEWAISQEACIQFLSIGASTYDAPDNVYAAFSKKIAASRYASHFDLLGWRAWEEIPEFYRASRVGINIDAMHYETMYGTRTRLLEMISAGLPVITSSGTELSQLLVEAGAGLTFEIGDWKAFGEAILRLARDPELCQQMGRDAQAYADGALSFGNTTEPLREWIKNPVRAPDRSKLSARMRLMGLEYKVRAWIRFILWKALGLA